MNSRKRNKLKAKRTPWVESRHSKPLLLKQRLSNMIAQRFNERVESQIIEMLYGSKTV